MNTSFEIGDIVKLVNPQKIDQSFIFNENVFKIAAVNPDRFNLSGLKQAVTTEDILPIKIDGIEDRIIYYRPIIAGSTVLPGQPVPVHTTEYTYYLDAFAKVKLENSDKTLQDLVREQDFEYVHEIQHFLRRRYHNDELKINYSIATQ